ncbi:neural proliferation differentiation and control protein 1-like [Ctenocephalides felis]|uniref:neural proliferation differentiation and control protein 1-like n=1 Tax=Ctenocephalides felis TaxID=7515 RepID=UPI000E6E15BB|nr:neural proliferation differentiation and control protein 1-like [Ctenocephalides felis]
MSKFSHHRDATQAVAQNDEHVEHENEKETTADKKLDGPEFTYNLPALGSHQIRDKEPPFAVGPNDPRYYGEEVHNSKVGGNDDQPLDLNSKFEPFSDYSLFDQGVKMTKLIRKRPLEDDGPTLYVVAMVAGISAAATVGLVAFGIGWLQKRSKLAQDAEYPAYGVTGPNVKDPNQGGPLQSPASLNLADKRLAQSAQLYHYHHQKQQILAMENRLEPSQVHNQSDPESDEENDEGDYTVYECPGLASTGEMEVKNPMFLDEPTPATPNEQNKSSPKDKN